MKVIIYILVTIGILFISLPILFLVFASGMGDESLTRGISSLEHVSQSFLSFDMLIIRFQDIFNDELMFKLLGHSLFLSFLVAIISSSFSLLLGYYITRHNSIFINMAIPTISLFTYLTPPVVLVISLSLYWSEHSQEYIWFKILFSHIIYLLPLALILAIAFWSQKPYEIDRISSSDGADFWERFLVHISIKEVLYFIIIAMLIFMISWSDIIFSRILASSDAEERLVVDFIFEFLSSADIIYPYGKMALFSLFVVGIASLFSILFGIVFYNGIIRNES